MQGYVALWLLGGISRSALAFSLAEDPQFPFKVPALDANRSPCPVLNALANHGYLPRDGMNINMEQLKFAFTKALNIDEKKHNVIEHDGSLSREDVAVTGNANKFDARVWNGVKAHFTGETIDTKTMAIARKDRVAVAMKTNPTFNMTEAQLKLSFAESAFILGVLAGDFQNPQAPTKYMNVMFEQESSRLMKDSRRRLPR
ncbi:chloroperoxidase-like protein [Colletotrichum camelliae]|nr:chloroperoxidase-like protein [Colletotrichum camelliae]